MPYQIKDESGQPLDALAEADTTGITLHSRGGSAARGAVNADYGPALRLLLKRLAVAQLPIKRAFVDSMDAQHLPIEDRTILRAGELDADGTSAFTLMSNRMKSIGQRPGYKGGNATKRIRIAFANEIHSAKLEQLVGLLPVAKDIRSLDRLPAEQLEKVTAEDIWNAIEKLRDPAFKHNFGPSTDFDLITSADERLPPKAVFGVAATQALGFKVLPKHFAAGTGTPCFRILERAGYPIVPKGEVESQLSIPENPEDREWSEGNIRLVSHLRRERDRGAAQAKKKSFIRTHGKLRCERCGMDPEEVFGGPHGSACIEVHHRARAVADMDHSHRTKLEDLQCLCANCHRVVHRLLKLELEQK